jgi:glycosyltransferase involved in cell wall biosynthesis
MRILYLNPIGGVGGAERALLSAMTGVMRADPSIKAHLIAMTDGPLLGLANEIGVRSMLLPMPKRLAEVGDSRHRKNGWRERVHGVCRPMKMASDGWGYRRLLRAAIKSIAPDLIHTNGIKSHLLAGLAGASPVVWYVQDFYRDRPLVRRLLPWAQRGVVGAITISDAVDRSTRTLLPGLPTRLVRHATDVDKFAPSSADPELLDRLAGLPPAWEGTIRVGLVATYARWKGHDVFLKAAAQLLQQKPGLPVRFYLIGGPIYHTQGSQFSVAELRCLAHSLGLEARLGFIGFQQNPADVYRGLDLVVHASTRPEPFGLTIIEAMACSRAVIVAAAGGAAELFTHDHDAFGVGPGDISGLARAIRTLVEDKQRRQRLAAQARRTAVCRFDQSRLGPEILEAYRAFLKRGSGVKSSQASAETTNSTQHSESDASEAIRGGPLICQEQ